MNAKSLFLMNGLATLLVAGFGLSACSPAAAPGAGEFTSSEAVSSDGSAANSTGSGETTPVQSGVLTAGDIDDNLNFQAFQTYLNSQLQADVSQALPPVALADRVTLKIVDATGQGVANAHVEVLAGDTVLAASAGANGVFQFFPAYDGLAAAPAVTIQARRPEASAPEAQVTFNLNELDATRTVEIRLEGVAATSPNALDLLLVIDTTGSMGDEIHYLQAELRDIVATVRAQFPAVSMRFGLVVYRDEGDAYVVRHFDFTDSVDTLQQQLGQQAAGGGGDYPEAMEQAMEQAMQLSWRGGNTARLLFLVADAPPHNENQNALLTQARAARQAGIHIYPLAASGVADTAEYLMRVMAATTHSRYLFLTDDSGVGNEHAEPKVPCYVVTRLDQLLVRVIASELSGQRVEATADQIIRTVGQGEGGVCVEK